MSENSPEKIKYHFRLLMGMLSLALSFSLDFTFQEFSHSSTLFTLKKFRSFSNGIFRTKKKVPSVSMFFELNLSKLIEGAAKTLSLDYGILSPPEEDTY